MSPRTFSDLLLRDCAVLSSEDQVGPAVQQVLDSHLPALPVQDADRRYCGIFGEREFFTAVFPGYLNTLQGAGFVTRSLDDALEKRSEARLERVSEHMNTEHVDVAPDFSDAELAEIFLHHRVLIIPVVDDGRVLGVITRREFFRVVAERFLAGS